MNSEYSILFQKEATDATVYDSEDNFGVVCTEIPTPTEFEAKQAYSNDWHDENGEDVYLGDTTYIKAYDWEFSCAVKGTTHSEASKKMHTFLNYLTTNGTKFKIYASWAGIGRQHCYFTKFSDVENYSDASGNTVIEFKLNIRVTDPTTCIKVNIVDSTYSLVAES